MPTIRRYFMEVRLMRTLLIFFVAMLALQPGLGMAETVNLAAGASGDTQRIAGHLDSWAALIIVASAMAVAWLLNVKEAKFRALGTALAALCCAAVAGWFFLFVVNTGFLENPKPNQTPLDSPSRRCCSGRRLLQRRRRLAPCCRATAVCKCRITRARAG